MSRAGHDKRERFQIDPESVATYRTQLRAMARGIPTAEAAIEGFNDWQVVEAMERIWAAGAGELERNSADAAAPRP